MPRRGVVLRNFRLGCSLPAYRYRQTGSRALNCLTDELVARGWDNAPGDLAKCFAHHDGIEKYRAKLEKRESAELKKAGARLRRITIKNHRAP